MGQLLGLVLYIGMAAAWVTHVVISIQASAWVLLVIGTLLAPIGVVHGVMIWLGVPWN